MTNVLEQFKKVEQQLIEVLKFEGIVLDGDLSSKETKMQLKNYIKKVNKAKELFEKYEDLALKIEKLALIDVEQNTKSENLIENIVDMREEPPEKEVYENVVIADENQVKVLKKKTKISSKEL